MEEEHEYFTPWSPLMQLSAAPANRHERCGRSLGREHETPKEAGRRGRGELCAEAADTGCTYHQDSGSPHPWGWYTGHRYCSLNCWLSAEDRERSNRE